jgi:predicted XRE-type DNA-binding protein
VDAAQILGMPQPKISAIRNYKLQGISLEQMMQALAALGQRVEIVVTPSSRRAPAGISVAA